MADAVDIALRFRQDSVQLDDEQAAAASNIRRDAAQLARTISESKLHPRYEATALTELETALMFAIKGLTQPVLSQAQPVRS